MYCTNCGANLPEGVKFCTSCGAKVEGGVASQTQGRAQAQAQDQTPWQAGGQTTQGWQQASDQAQFQQGQQEAVKPPRRRRVGAIVAAVIVILALCGAGVGGFLTDWYGIPELIAGRTDQADSPVEKDEGQTGETVPEEDPVSASGITIRASLGDYSWEELSQISSEIGAAPDKASAIQVAHGYNLCGPNGELANMPSKSITLSNGTELHARVIGIYHDQRTDGGVAGLSFLFDEVVALNPWKESGYNDGGWQASSVRSWLSMTFLETLPDDLKGVLATVNKRTNNAGGVDSGTLDPSVVSVTPERLWLPSHVELAGNGPEDVHWAVSHYGTQYTWCNDITSDEGTQYDLFSEVDTQGFAANSILVRTYEGQACKWWMRSPNPHFTYVSLTVAEDGALDDDVGSIEAQGVVPGFCV